MLFIKETIGRNIQFNIFPAEFVFCKIDIFLLPSLLNRILSVASVNTGSVVGGSVVGESVDW